MIPILALAPPSPPVTVDSILSEMPDLRRLAHRPYPWYRYVQSTSYDRSMAKDPYANTDAGHFLRAEGKERVMADVKGPGALVRLWSANPVGTLRFYFDGEVKPRLEADMRDLLTGKNPMFPEPYAYVAAQGCNLFYPMPYAKGLKVTWEGPSDKAIYYAVGTREYALGTRAVTYVPGAGTRSLALRTAKALLPTLPATLYTDKVVPAGGTLAASFATANGGELQDLEIRVDAWDDPNRSWGDPNQRHNLLRRLRLRMSFDGETTVDVPLGDFFGSPVGLNSYESLPMAVGRDGTLLARWSMPFRRSARIWIENGNAVPVEMTLGARQRASAFTPGTYLFHARWHSQTRPTMPRYDFTFLDSKGEGRVVGAALLVSNPVPAWWGEGDEKVSVDGEAFPSLFGTGTEDYFGYAWSDPAPFERPYHAQPPTPNLGNLGQTENLRFHVVDDIPFKKGIRFDMEAWHWANVTATYATTAYWYALPGTTLPEPPNPAALAIPEMPTAKKLKGAIEGEGLNWTLTGGFSQIQGGFAELSGGQQFWWRDVPPGATATAKITVPTAGRYELIGNLGHAEDYGRFRVEVNGQNGRELDLYQPSLEWRKESLGTYDLPAGEITLRFFALESNPKSTPGRNMLGVDYLLLEKR